MIKEQSIYYIQHVRDMLKEHGDLNVEPSPEDCKRWAEILSKCIESLLNND